MVCEAELDPDEDHSIITYALQSFYHNSVYRPMSDVFLGLDGHDVKPVNPTKLDPSQQQQVLEQILASGKLDKEQKKIIDDMFSIDGAVGLIQGGAGTGKTETVAALATGYQRAGRTVVFFAKTHGATNKVYQRAAIKCHEQGLPRPVRFFREGNERQWVRDAGQPRPEKAPDALEEAAILLYGASAETSALIQRTELKELRRFEMPIASVAQAILDEYVMPKEGNPKPLKIRDSQAKENKYPVVYRDDDKLIKAAKDEAKRTKADINEIDGVQEILHFYARLDSEDPKDKMTREDWRELDRVSTQLLRQYIKSATCVATTLGNAGKVPIRQAIGHKTKGVVVICDEASMITETTLIHALIALCPTERMLNELGPYQSMLNAIWLVGDTKQSRDMLFNKTHSEFSGQYALSPFERLVSNGHKTYTLTTNYRTHQFIIDQITNDIFYEGQLINGPGTESTSRMHTPQAREALRQYLKLQTHCTPEGKDEQECIDERTHLRFIYLTQAEDQITQAKSKVNLTSINWMMSFIMKFFLGVGFGERSGPLLDASEWKYVTPYQAQHKLYQVKAAELLNKIMPRSTATMKDIPEALVADSAQGLEFKHMIYEITSVDKLGMISDDNKFTTHWTRGRDTVWIVGNLKVLNKQEEKEAGLKKMEL